jgi:hypothetical protein
MGTEKCPFCGQEIDAGATKCFFCGAKLDKESVERHLEQLHYQQALLSSHKIHRPVALAVVAAGILLVIVLFHGLPGGKKPSVPLLEQPSVSSTLSLNARVNFAGGRFVVSNNDSFDWQNVKLEIVPSDLGEPFSLAVTGIPAGGTHAAEAAEFRRPDGTWFNASSMKSARFRIRCDVRAGRSGSYVTEWQ